MFLGLVVGLALVLSGAWPPSAISTRGGVSRAVPSATATTVTGGRLLVPMNGLALIGLPNVAITYPPGVGRPGVVTSARWAPDGRSAAFAFYYNYPGEPTPRTEIYLTDLRSAPRLLVGRDQGESAAQDPSWAPDGRAIYFGYAAQEGQRRIRRIERIDVASNVRGVVTDGTRPSVSPDGSLLAFVLEDGRGYSLMVARADGADLRTLVPFRRFSQVNAPRFSPDGRSLAFSASLPLRQNGESVPAHPFAWLRPSTALAHGLPTAVYLVDIAGGEPRQVSPMVDDEIELAWSPDGGRLAMHTENGLYLLELDGRTTPLLDRGGHGGIDWAR